MSRRKALAWRLLLANPNVPADTVSGQTGLRVDVIEEMRRQLSATIEETREVPF